MRVYVISVDIVVLSAYQLLDVFMIVAVLFGLADSCSPPKTKTEEFSTYSLLERASKAHIVIVGSVVEFDNDNRHSVTARIGVHVKLKGDNVSRVVNVTGFHASRKQKNKVHSMDCTVTTVELYGTYLFFIKPNHLTQQRTYIIDEILMHPAAEKIPCTRQVSTDMRKLLKKYRKPRNNNQVLCFKRTKVVRNCLRKKWKATFWRLVNKFTYGNVRPRTVYCSTHAAKHHNNNHNTTTSHHKRTRYGGRAHHHNNNNNQHGGRMLNPFIPMRKLLPAAGLLGTTGTNKDIYSRSRSRRHFVYRRTDTTISVFTDTRTTGLRYNPDNAAGSRLRSSSSVRKEDIKLISDWQVVTTKSRDNIASVSSATSVTWTTRPVVRILLILAATRCLLNSIF